MNASVLGTTSRSRLPGSAVAESASLSTPPKKCRSCAQNWPLSQARKLGPSLFERLDSGCFEHTVIAGVERVVRLELNRGIDSGQEDVLFDVRDCDRENADFSPFRLSGSLQPDGFFEEIQWHASLLICCRECGRMVYEVSWE